MSDQPAAEDDMEKRTAQMVWVRDEIKKIEERHKLELKDFKEIKSRLEGKIQAFMDAHNLDNLKTKAGTCYRSSKTTASLADPQAFMDYVINMQAFDLLDRRANVTAVKEFVKKHTQLPPGVNLNTISTVGVRRGTGGGEDE